MEMREGNFKDQQANNSPAILKIAGHGRLFTGTRTHVYIRDVNKSRVANVIA